MLLSACESGGDRGRSAGAEEIVEAHFARAEYDRAADAGGAVLASGGASARLRYLVGESLRRLQRFEEAATVLSALLEAQPEHPGALLALARVKSQIGEPAESIPAFEAYLRRPPDSPPELFGARRDYARELRKAGSGVRAAEILVELLELEPGNVELYHDLAGTFYRLKMRSQAELMESIFKRAASSAFEDYAAQKFLISGHEAIGHLQMAQNRERDWRILEAFSHLEKAIALAPADPRCRIAYAKLCLRVRRHRQARRRIDEGLKLAGDSRGAGVRSGLYWLAARSEIEAGAFAPALELAGKCLQCLETEPVIDEQDSAAARAREAFETALEAALESWSFAAAEAFLAAASRRFPDAGWVSFWRGRLALERGDAEQTLKFFQQAAAGEPAVSPELAFWTAVALGRSGRQNLGLRGLLQAGKSNPMRPRLYEELARLAEGESEALRRDIDASRRRSEEARRRIAVLELEIDRLPLKDCGERFHELAQFFLAANQDQAYPLLMLAADLSPGNPQILEPIIAALRQPEDVFHRLRFLRRLLVLAPEDPNALSGIAGIYSQLGIRLEEADRLAGRFHELSPGAYSHRLLGEIEIARGQVERGRRILEDGAVRFPQDEALRRSLEKTEKTEKTEEAEKSEKAEKAE